MSDQRFILRANLHPNCQLVVETTCLSFDTPLSQYQIFDLSVSVACRWLYIQRHLTYIAALYEKLKSDIYRKAYSATVVIGYETQDLKHLRN